MILQRIFKTGKSNPAVLKIAYTSRRGIAYSGKTYKLNTGAKIPAVGFGTFQDPDEQEGAVTQALKAGFRHIDTARVYDTEKQIGKAIKKSSVPREDIFLTTKLWCNSYHPEDVGAALDASLKDLDSHYVDLLLMHYPCTFERGLERFPKDENGKMRMGKTTYVDTWKALEEVLATGKVKAIGVSNFSKGEVEQLLKAGSVVPAVHQMEVHPLLAQKVFTEWHKTKGIHVTQFSPLANQNSFYRDVHWSNGRANRTHLIDEPILHEIGKKYNKSAAQVALSWGINHDRSVIPKSVIPWQIAENLASDFKMDDEDVKKIDALDQKLRFNDPSEEYRWKLYRDLEGV